MRTGLNMPRSPPLLCELQSLYLDASSANFSGEPLISAAYPLKISMASSFVRVMFDYAAHQHKCIEA